MPAPRAHGGSHAGLVFCGRGAQPRCSSRPRPAEPPETADVGIAPYLRELIGRYAATGLLPGYLPTPHVHDHDPNVTEPTP